MHGLPINFQTSYFRGLLLCISNNKKNLHQCFATEASFLRIQLVLGLTEGGLGETEASISCSFCCSNHLRMILFLMPLNRRTSCEVQTDRSVSRQGDLMHQWWNVLGSDSSGQRQQRSQVLSDTMQFLEKSEVLQNFFQIFFEIKHNSHLLVFYPKKG